MNFKISGLERFKNDTKVQEVVENYKGKVTAFFEGMVNSPEDMIALEELALEAAEGSPEMQEVFKKILIERRKVRDAQNKEYSKDLVVDAEGKLVHRNDVLTGENQ